MHKELHHVSQSLCNHVVTVRSSVMRVFTVSEDLEMVTHIIHSVTFGPTVVQYTIISNIWLQSNIALSVVR